MKYYGASKNLYDRALLVTPGASQTGSKAPGRAGPLNDYPLFLDSGNGVLVSDVDGNVYIDFIASLAAVGIGHADPRVLSPVREALALGSLLSLPTAEEVEASEALLEAIGWGDQVRWVKTGSEATEAAIRIARAFTRRSNILTVSGGYHSWHSWFQAIKDQHPGVPDGYEDMVYGMDYLADLDDWVFENYAAVILEPAPITGGGDAEWLRDLKVRCDEAETILVFDEVVWGFRLAVGGGSQFFDVTPDLATYGKALGNGIPVGAVVGKCHIMRHAGVISGTFGGDRLGLTAAMAVTQVYKDPSVIDWMRQMGERLGGHIHAFGTQDNVTLDMTGYAVHPILKIDVEGQAPEVAMSYFLQRLADHGVLWHPAGGNIMAAHTEATIDRAALAIIEAAEETGIAAKGQPLADLVKPYEQAFARAR